VTSPDSSTLRIGLASYLRVLIVALVGGGVFGVVAFMGVTMKALELWLGTPNIPQTYAALLLAPFAAVVVILPLLCLRLRRGARHVSWDHHGVTEREGETVRVFIPRSNVRVASQERTRTRYRYSRKVVDNVHHVVQLSDDEGRRITVAWRNPWLAIGLRALPRWMRHRPVLTARENIMRLLAAFPPDASAPPVAPDARAARRPLAAVSTFLHVLAFGFGGFALEELTLSYKWGAIDRAGLAFVASGVLFALAIARPMSEWLAVVRASRCVASAEPVTFRVDANETVSVVLANGQVLAADVSGLKHPDAHVYRREVPVRAIVEVAAGAVDIYRGARARALVRVVDTEPERAERRGIAIANALEIAGRAAHAFLLIVLGVLMVLGIQRF
jgi:hypothetical protein